jgi:hypothetical protein
MTLDMDSIIERINERLSTLGLSEREASIAATGKPDSIRTIRRGAIPSVTTVDALARVLSVPIEWLLYGKESPTPTKGLDRNHLQQVLIGAHPIMTSIITQMTAAGFAKAILDTYDHTAKNENEN